LTKKNKHQTKTAQDPSPKYFCKAVTCPGYDFRASETPHPFGTCGAILGNIDDPTKKPELPMIPAPEQTSPVNDLPDEPTQQSALTVDESNVGKVSSPDTPLLAPDQDDDPLPTDSPAAQGQALPEASSLDEVAPETPHDGVELPSPAVDLLPRLVTDIEQIEYFCEPSSAAPLGKAPKPGTWWAEAIEAYFREIHCYEVTGVNVTEGFALCDFHIYDRKSEVLVHLAHFVNGDLVPYLTQPSFTRRTVRARDEGSVLPFICDASSRGLRPSPSLNMWVPDLDSWWFDSTDRSYFQVRKVNEEPRLNAGLKEVSVNNYTQTSTNRAFGIMSLTSFLDGSLEYIGDQSQIETMPLWKNWLCEQVQSLSQPQNRSDDLPLTFSEVCVGIATELDVEPVHVERIVIGYLGTFTSFLLSKSLTATSPAVVSFVEKMKAKNAVLVVTEILQGFMQRAAQTGGTPAYEHALDNGSIAQLDKVVAYINEKLEPRLDALEQRFGTDTMPPLEQLEQMRRAGSDLAESLVKDMTELKERMDEVETDRIRRDKQLSAQRRKNAQKPGGPKVITREAKRRTDRARRDRKAKQESDNLRAAFAQRGEPLEEVFKPKRGRPKGTTLNSGAKRGRPKGSKTKKKALIPENKPISQAPKASRWDTFMGASKDPKILAMLNRIAPKNVDNFLKQAKKGAPSMKLTPWNDVEQANFFKWYFGT
jgi:hypothetical protein